MEQSQNGACFGVRQSTSSLMPLTLARQFSILKTLLGCVSFFMAAFFLAGAFAKRGMSLRSWLFLQEAA